MVIIAFGLVLFASVGAYINDKIPCTDIIDIYTKESFKDIIKHDKCPYTVTVICEENCSSHYISRDNYENDMKDWDIYNMPRPFPKRTDINRVFQAAGRYGENKGKKYN